MMKRILVFGDSIVRGANDFERGGWTDRLRNHCINQKDANHVYNLGVSGDDSKYMLARLENECKARLSDGYNADNIIIISVGLNDLRSFKEPYQSEIPIDEYKKNITQIIDKAKQFVDIIIFVGMTPADDSKMPITKWTEPVSFLNEHIDAYDEAAESICKDKNIHFIKLRDRFEAANLDDGIHPDAEGHKKIFNIVLKELKNLNITE